MDKGTKQYWLMLTEFLLYTKHCFICTYTSCLNNPMPGISLEGMMLKLKLQYFGTSCEELTHWKRLWCWEGLEAGGEGDARGCDGWMASLTWWTWVWVNSGNWWWTGRPGVLRFMGSQRVGHNWATELKPDIKELCTMSLFWLHFLVLFWKRELFSIKTLTCFGFFFLMN